jgi:hypothetical protein
MLTAGHGMLTAGHDQLTGKENKLSLYLNSSIDIRGQAEFMGRCNEGVYPSLEHLTQSS